MFILDVEKAVADGVATLNYGRGLFRGEICEIVKDGPTAGTVYVSPTNSLEPNVLQCVNRNHLIEKGDDKT